MLKVLELSFVVKNHQNGWWLLMTILECWNKLGTLLTTYISQVLLRWFMLSLSFLVTQRILHIRCNDWCHEMIPFLLLHGDVLHPPLCYCSGQLSWCHWVCGRGWGECISPSAGNHRGFSCIPFISAAEQMYSIRLPWFPLLCPWITNQPVRCE